MQMHQNSLLAPESAVAPVHADANGPLVQPAGAAAKPALTGQWLEWPRDAALLERHWSRLASRACEPNIFNERSALGAALDSFEPGAVRLFTLWDEQDDPDRISLLGLIPIISDERYGRWPLPHWRNWLHANAFLGNPLVAAGHEHDFWRLLLATLESSVGMKLFFHIEGLVLGGALEKALLAVAREENRPVGLVASEDRAFIHSIADADAYFEDAVRGKKRKELRRQKRRLEEEGALTFERSGGATPDELKSWIDEFLALERQGWKGESGSALACDAATEAMFRKTLAGAAGEGRLDLVAMRLDGRAIAMLVNLIAPPGAFSYKTAYDEDYARFSPGVLLQHFNLGLMTRSDIEWCDSCAAENHPMIDHIWRDRRGVGRYSVGIGGPLRRTIYRPLLNWELQRLAARRQRKEEAR